MKLEKRIRIPLFLLAGAAVLTLAVALVIPPVAEYAIEKKGSELTGRKVTIGNLRYNLFTGKLRIEKARIDEQGDTATFASIEELYTKLRLLPLVRRHIHIEAIALTRPDVKIYQEGNRLNFDDLIALMQPAEDTLASAQGKPWRIDIDDIRLKGGHLFYKDMQRNVIWGFNDLNVDIPGLHLDGHERTDMGVIFNFSRGGSLHTTLSYDQSTSDYDLRLQLHELALHGTAAYFRQLFDVGSVSGLLSTDMHVRGNTQHLLDLRTEGTIDIRDLKIDDAQGNPVLAVDSAGMALLEGNLLTMRYAIDRISIAGLATRFERYADGTDNLSRLLLTPGERPVETESDADDGEATLIIEREEPAEARLNFTVGRFELTDGKVDIADLSLPHPFSYTLSHIALRSDDIDFSRNNSLTAEARLQRTGTARIRWEGSLRNMDNQNLTVLLSNIDLKDFSPYSEYFTAYPITEGNLTFRSQNIITDRYLKGTNHLDMFGCTVEKRMQDAEPEFRIPLRLGLYVLKDRKGHVKLDLPVHGSIDSPEFSYRKIVMKALGNVLLKVVTSPFSFLSGHGDNLDHIGVDPLQIAFDAEQYARLDKIARALQEKPELKIVLTQGAQRSEALRRLEGINLKMACYNASQPQGAHLTMVDFERIEAMKLNSDRVTGFADSLLVQRGIDGSRMTPPQKAEALYGDQAREQLVRLFERRNKALTDYLVSVHGIPAASVQVETASLQELDAWKGKPRYTILMEMEDNGSERTSAPSDPATEPAS